ncbi:hypothetical protein [Azohydromonas aeria]|uniref:hypothetical protein n=1 Tax=Azohydromonas aeria TaxID=2590212 RepID=UPI0012FCCFDA|nr:hypothetical protein [Azohydromonas aeria]
MNTHRLQLRPALAGSLASALVLLAACGGGGDTPASAGATAMVAATEASKTLPPGDNRVKWNPGHYIQLNAGAGEFMINRTFSEIAALPNVRGVQMRYQWRDLEPTKGNYDFSRIERDLAFARASGKKLAILVGTKAFAAGSRALPDYLRTDEYEGGVYRILIDGRDTLGTESTTGENMAIWVPGVRDRLIALTQALGQRYNADNTFDSISFNETAFGNAVVPLTSAQKQGYFDNLALMNNATRQAFPNTVVLQFFNFPRIYLPNLVNNAINNGVGLGGPDTFLNDPALDLSTYPFYDTAAGKVPLGPSVQGENYFTTYQYGPYNPPAVTDLYAYARDRLKANYIFWNKVQTQPLVPYNNVLAMFRSASFPKDAAGGLATTCPTSLPACTPQL